MDLTDEEENDMVVTKVRSDELSLLAKGIKRALLNRANYLKLSVDENGWMWLKDEVTGEIVTIDLEGVVENYPHGLSNKLTNL